MVKVIGTMNDPIFKPINVEYHVSYFDDLIGLVYPSLPVFVYDEGKRYFNVPESVHMYRCRNDIEVCNFSTGPVLQLKIRTDYIELLEGIAQATINDIPVRDRSFHINSGARANSRRMFVLIYRHDLREILTRARDYGFLVAKLIYLEEGYVEKNKELFSTVSYYE
jgi:hypothetical protein